MLSIRTWALAAMRLVAIILLTTMAHARVRVAFLEIHDATGKPVALEPGGRFGHVAISYHHGWLHSYPGRPVEWVPDLKPYGKVVETITLPDVTLSTEQVTRELGKPFDYSFDWDDPHSSYCAKLVARLLHIPPQPMTFSTSYWHQVDNEWAVGELGLSPDDIYEELRFHYDRRHQVTLHGCQTLLIQ